MKGSLAGACFKSGAPIFVEHFDKEKDAMGFSEEMIALVDGLIQSMVAWPLKVNGKTVAVFIHPKTCVEDNSLG